MSPAEPWAPRWSRPSEMIPAPIPVPILTTTTLSWPWAIPARHSPRASTLTSLSTQTGAPNRRGEPLPDRVAVPAGHDRRRDRPPGRRTPRAPGTPSPDAPDRRRAAGARSAAAGRTAPRPGPGSPRGRRRCPRAPCSGRGSGRRGPSGRRRCSSPRGPRPGPARRRRGRRGGAAAGPPVLGPMSPSIGEPAVQQLLDPARDDRPAQPGPLDQVGARPRGAVADLVEDLDQGVEHLLGQSARRPPDSGQRRVDPHGADRTPGARIPSPRPTFVVDRSKYAGAAQVAAPGRAGTVGGPRRNRSVQSSRRLDGCVASRDRHGGNPAAWPRTNGIATAVIGSGFIGVVHIEALRRIGVRVTGLLSASRREGRPAARRRWASPGATRSLEELLADPEVDGRPRHLAQRAPPSRRSSRSSRPAGTSSARSRWR